MPESESKSNSKTGYLIAIIVALIACFGGVLSAIIAKIPVPTLPAFTATPIVIIVTETPIAISTNPAPTDIPMLPSVSPNIIVLPTLSPTNTNIPSSPSPYQKGSDTFGAYPAYPVTKRQVILGEGEVYVGTAVRFAARSYGCNTIDMNANIPLTAFIIRGPIQVDIEIDNGGWDYWANVFNEDIAKNLLIPKVNEVAAKGKYIECVIPPFQ